jgi:hypothetical protein
MLNFGTGRKFDKQYCSNMSNKQARVLCESDHGMSVGSAPLADFEEIVFGNIPSALQYQTM